MISQGALAAFKCAVFRLYSHLSTTKGYGDWFNKWNKYSVNNN